MTRCSTLLVAALATTVGWSCDRDRGSARRSGSPEARPPASRPDPAARRRPPALPIEAIPTPPLRLDARVTPEELSLLPPGAAVTLMGRPDLLDRLLGSRGPLATLFGRLPLGARIAALAGRSSPSEALGLDARRYWVAALLPPPENQLGPWEASVERSIASAKPPVPATWPPLTLRARVVAALGDAARTRAFLAELPQHAARLGWPGILAATSPDWPQPLKGLASAGALLVVLRDAEGWAMVVSVVGSHLVCDVVLTVSGSSTAARLAEVLSAALAAPPLSRAPTRDATTPPSQVPPTGLLGDPFGRVALLAGADLTLLVGAEALADAALLLGMRRALATLGDAPPDTRAGRLREAWRIARLPRAFAKAQPRPFDRLAVHLHVIDRTPLVSLSWRMTPTGRRLLDPLLPKVAGRDLAKGRRFVDELLRPLAAAVQTKLPAVEPWMDAGLLARLTDGGPLTWAVVLATHWPRLLPIPPVRKALLDRARQEIRIGRFVGRVNAQGRGELFTLRVEGRWPTDNAGAAPRPPG